MRFKAACSTLTRLAAGLAAGLAASLLAAACTAAQSVQPSAPAVTTVPTAPAAPSAPAALSAPSADAILERNFAALGGRDKIHAVRSLRLEATQSAGEKRLPLRLYWKRPDRLRIEARDEGLDALQVFDGEQAWFTYPALPGFEIQFLEGAEREALRAQADLVEGPTFDYAAKGHRVELVAREKLPGTEIDAWRLLLTTAQGEVRTLWFDTSSMLQVREERRERRGDKEAVIESNLSDFRPAGGILFAHRVEERLFIGGEAQGVPSVVTIEKLELDLDLPDSLFTLPAASPAPAAQEAPKAPA